MLTEVFPSEKTVTGVQPCSAGETCDHRLLNAVHKTVHLFSAKKLVTLSWLINKRR